VNCRCLLTHGKRSTSIKSRIVAHQQQVVRVDRESRHELDGPATRRLLAAAEPCILSARAVIICDYGKGVVTQGLLDALRHFCHGRGVWLSVDPKPVHHLNLGGLSLITPNRKEAFELAGLEDSTRHPDPLRDTNLIAAAEKLLNQAGLRLVPADAAGSELYAGHLTLLDHAVVSTAMRELAPATRTHVAGACAAGATALSGRAAKRLRSELSDHCPIVLDLSDHDFDP